jgi:pyrrolidone-carboxylate peptidase
MQRNARSTWRLRGAALLVPYFLIAGAAAQMRPEPAGTPLPSYAKVYPVPAERGALALPRTDNGLPNVMLTGYWPPTNEMLRQFNPSATQNPDGWVGENWDGRGYNVYAFFPEFPNGLGQGEGDFEVDYQDTSADFWPYTVQLEPLAIITFGRALQDTKWQIESRARNLSYGQWYEDYLVPLRPTPAPPDANMPAGYMRYCSLPAWEIVNAVADAGLNVVPVYHQVGDAGAFLCEYIAYHGMWYHDLHVYPSDPLYNIAAGHIHVGGLVTLEDAIAATEVTVRTLADYLDLQRKVPGDLNCDGVVNYDDIDPFVLALSDQQGYRAAYPGCPWINADADGTGTVDFDDINAFLALLSAK